MYYINIYEIMNKSALPVLISTMAFLATHAIHIYYAYLILAGFEHSVCLGSLMTTYIPNKKKTFLLLG